MVRKFKVSWWLVKILLWGGVETLLSICSILDVAGKTSTTGDIRILGCYNKDQEVLLLEGTYSLNVMLTARVQRANNDQSQRFASANASVGVKRREVFNDIKTLRLLHKTDAPRATRTETKFELAWT